MQPGAILFLVLTGAALWLLPRRWAPLPLLMGACYMTPGQAVEIGPFNFTILRLLIGIGALRVVTRREAVAGAMNRLDGLMIAWGAWALFSSLFHKDVSAALVYRLGLVYNACGVYFLLRVLCRSLEDVASVCRFAVILLIPVALEMLFEQISHRNWFGFAFGGINLFPEIRKGRVRAQGPFAHAILAGTVAAVFLPIAVGLWRQYRRESLLGIGVCLVMVVACSSSGPLLSAMAGGCALFMWRYRRDMRTLRWVMLFTYIGLDIVMKAPAYYILARIDLAGGSTGWFRARLIESSIEHLSEWWWAGTDYTRHWMPSGVPWSKNHTDITNHYLAMGVIGGLPLMLLFIAVLAEGFRLVGRTVRFATHLTRNSRFLLWSVGASLFANAVASVSISYFDQSWLFLYLPLAVIGSASSAVAVAQRARTEQLNDAPTPPLDAAASQASPSV